MFNWKHGFRGLQLLHCMLLQGPPGMLTEALAHYPLIYSLTEYRIGDSSACTAERRQHMRLIAHNIVKLLLDQKHLAVRRQFGDQVRTRQLPHVGLEKQLVARLALSVQRTALADRASASVVADKGYGKSIKSASKRLSSMNFSGDSFMSQSRHPQSIDAIPKFSKKHDQFQQMMEIMRVVVTTDEMGVVKDLGAFSPQDRARRKSVQRRLSCRTSSGPGNDICGNLLDFDYVACTESPPLPPNELHSPEQQRPQQKEKHDEYDPFSDFDGTFRAHSPSPPPPPKPSTDSLAQSGARFDPFASSSSGPGSGHIDVFEAPVQSKVPPPVARTQKTDDMGFPVSSSSQNQGQRNLADSSGDGQRSSGPDPFSSFGAFDDPFSSPPNTTHPPAPTQKVAMHRDDPFAGFDTTQSPSSSSSGFYSDPFPSSSNAPSTSNFTDDGFGGQRPVSGGDDGFGTSFGSSASPRPQQQQHGGGFSDDGCLLSLQHQFPPPAAGMGSPGMQTAGSRDLQDPFAELSGSEGAGGAPGSGRTRPNMSVSSASRPQKQIDPFADIGGWGKK